VNSIACDSQDRIWLGTDFGLAVFDGNEWLHYTRNTSELLSNDIETIVVTGASPTSLPPAPVIEPGDIRGTVQSSGQPVAGATVVACWQTVPFYTVKHHASAIHIVLLRMRTVIFISPVSLLINTAWLFKNQMATGGY